MTPSRYLVKEITMKSKYILLSTIFLGLVMTGVTQAADRPNILWIFQEDTSPWIG